MESALPYPRAFNGQMGRRALFLDLCYRLPFSAAIETGTFGGETTEFLLASLSVPVFSVELERDRFELSEARLAGYKQLRLRHGDSREFLRTLAKDVSCPSSEVFFYLDAHWNQDLPLREELQVIFSHWSRTVVMIDDFQVPLDAGYGFDAYGHDQTLCLEFLASVLPAGTGVFFPTLPSGDETGARRGCVVLASATDVISRLEACPGLYRHNQPIGGH